jgi:hypothetical protein
VPPPRLEHPCWTSSTPFHAPIMVVCTSVMSSSRWVGDAMVAWPTTVSCASVWQRHRSGADGDGRAKAPQHRHGGEVGGVDTIFWKNKVKRG